MPQNHSPLPPEPQLVGDLSRQTPPAVGRAIALMAVGIALPIASAWLMASVLHLWRWNHALPWAIQGTVTVLSLGCEIGAVALGWRARATSVGARVVVGVAGLAALLLGVFAVTGLGKLASMLRGTTG